MACNQYKGFSVGGSTASLTNSCHPWQQDHSTPAQPNITFQTLSRPSPIQQLSSGGKQRHAHLSRPHLSMPTKQALSYSTLLLTQNQQLPIRSSQSTATSSQAYPTLAPQQRSREQVQPLHLLQAACMASISTAFARVSPAGSEQSNPLQFLFPNHFKKAHSSQQGISGGILQPSNGAVATATILPAVPSGGALLLASQGDSVVTSHALTASSTNSKRGQPASRKAKHETDKQDAPALALPEASMDRVEESRHMKDPFRSLKLLFSGAMSAVVSRTTVAPFERVKMEMVLKNRQGNTLSTASQVFRGEGIRGFWKGNALNLLRTAPFKAVNFFSFDLCHHTFMRVTGKDSNFERFAAGACAGVMATLVCFPLDVVRTRLMSTMVGPRYGGPFQTLHGICTKEGFTALYSGCLPAVIGMAPAGAVFYGVYDLLKHQHLAYLDKTDPMGSHHLKLTPAYTLLYGAMAGAASELFVYPLEVIRRNMQLHCMASAAARSAGTGTVTAAQATFVLPGGRQLLLSGNFGRVGLAVATILKADGLKGFYSGLLPNMLQVLPSAALSYYTYDTLKTYLCPTDLP